jgi:hypothetical protein
VEVKFDLRAIFNGPLFWLIALAAFAIGFYWEFRGAIRRCKQAAIRNARSLHAAL